MEKRTYPRITASFPIRITPDIIGETVDISETGLSFILEKPLLLSKATAKIELSPKESIETEFKVIWNKHLVQRNKFRYGVCFIRLKQRDIEILRRVSSQSLVIDEKFIKLTAEFKNYLEDLKAKFDDFDSKNLDPEKQIRFLEEQKGVIFKKFDSHFEKVWDIVNNLDVNMCDLYKKYYVKKFKHLFGESIEINWHIYTKPLGYAGDYITMNYIYDYYKNNYLGDTSFQRLFNNYTCNIPIAKSNIIRKDFFKEKILETIKLEENPKIASIGSGPMRELIELLQEDKIKKRVEFMCLDFEKKAINYVKDKIENLDKRNTCNLHIQYIHKNVVQLLKERVEDDHFDLIYVAGVFDYLKDRICSRLARKLYDLLDKNGVLIICNASSENVRNRAYYEFLGGWVMIHRTKQDMLSWTKEFKDIAEIKFEQPSGFVSYLFLSIRKLNK